MEKSPTKKEMLSQIESASKFVTKSISPEFREYNMKHLVRFAGYAKKHGVSSDDIHLAIVKGSLSK